MLMQDAAGIGRSRANPVPLGEAAEAGPLEIEVLEVLAGADAVAAVLGASPMNSEPRDGTTFVAVNLQAIFDGEQPDIFLKPNDLVNVGTDAVAPFLAVMRNAYRFSYGFGFVYDRNFAPQQTPGN